MNLQENIQRIKEIMNMDVSNSDLLSQLVQQDQVERKEYMDFVNNELGGDYEKGAKEWIKLKHRNPDDIFLDKDRMNKFIYTNFDFDSFNKKDWDNYWLLSQHADQYPDFQKTALNIIQKHTGEDNDNFKYLSDRISCRETGTQIYGTQNICKKY
jgi:hypothetical protein